MIIHPGFPSAYGVHSSIATTEGLLRARLGTSSEDQMAQAPLQTPWSSESRESDFMWK